MATLAEQLSEAQTAYHRLQIGDAAVRFTDQNGESVEYNRASAPRLAAYIKTLEAQVAGQPRPNTIRFTTSKGLT
jgi:gpW protein